MSKTDFFELLVGVQHRECIEVETDYDRGVMDERKRSDAEIVAERHRCQKIIAQNTEQLLEEIKKLKSENDSFKAKRCETCIFWQRQRCRNKLFPSVVDRIHTKYDFGCNLHEQNAGEWSLMKDIVTN